MSIDNPKRAVLKSVVLISAAIWHGWLTLPGTPAGFLIGLVPYILLIMTWSYIRTPALLMLALVIMAWSHIDAGVAFKDSRSSTAGVGLGLQALFACAVVGAVVLIRAFLPGLKRAAPKDRSA